MKGREADLSRENGNSAGTVNSTKASVVRKAKLIFVDLAGSERINKSGILCLLVPVL